jgi:regulator of RNase E activity RraA
MSLPVRGPEYSRPPESDIEALRPVGAATASGVLFFLGVRQPHLIGPRPLMPGERIVGSALTLQFMPMRQDFGVGVGQEEVEKTLALWGVLEAIEPGDILTMQAYGDRYTGCMGEILFTYFRERGGAGLIVDGYVRDWPRLKGVGLPIWALGTTPNFGTQAGLFPFAYDTPIACGEVLVLPGDIMIADDDGAVVVPAQLAQLVASVAAEIEETELFSRMQIAAGGDLRKYYPLDADGLEEFESWKEARGLNASIGDGVHSS